MARHAHKFQRLSDEAIFCECGEIKRLAAPAPTPNVTIYPYVPYAAPYYVPNPSPTFIWSKTDTNNTTFTAVSNVS